MPKPGTVYAMNQATNNDHPANQDSARSTNWVGLILGVVGGIAAIVTVVHIVAGILVFNAIADLLQ